MCGSWQMVRIDICAEQKFVRAGDHRWVHPTAAVGRALANPNRTVHCLISDGECAEGSVWESLKFIQENNIRNIKIYVNVNGYCAYDKVDTAYLEKRLKAFLPDIVLFRTSVNRFSFLNGINAHYHIMSPEDYKAAKGENK